MYYSASRNGFYSTINYPNVPSDIVEITTSYHRDLLNGQYSGKIIKPNQNGFPVLVDPEPASVVDMRSMFRVNIDTAAGGARARYVSSGQFIDDEYKLTREQTAQWRSAGSPADSVPMAIQAWADATGMTPEQAASDIERISEQWEAALMEIRRIRLLGKAAVNNAPDDADFAAVAQPFIDQLDAMGGE